MRSADLTNETAHGGDEALADGQPDAEPEGPAPDTGCADGPHRPSAADHAGAAHRANLATRAGASTPGEALQRDPPETSAGSEARETTPNTPQRADEGGTSPSGHDRDDVSFDAFMDSCRDDPQAVPAPETPRVHPEPQRDEVDDAPFSVPRQAHLQRDYTSLGQIATTGEGQVTASGAADRTMDERNAPGEGGRVEAATNTASEPVAPPPGAAPPWGRGHLDYARLDGDASHPSEQAEQEATQDPQACHRGAARTGRPHTMGTFFAVPPPRGGNTHHGRRHVLSSDRAHAPRHHGPPRPMALCGHPAHGAYGSLQPR